MSIRVQNHWFFFPVKVENLNFSKIRIFWWEISTAYRNFRLNEKISLKNFKIDVNHWTVLKASNLVGWSYETRFSLLDAQTFVEKKIIEIGVELVIFIKKLLNSEHTVFFTSKKVGSNLQSIRKLVFALWVRLMNVANSYLGRTFCLS